MLFQRGEVLIGAAAPELEARAQDGPEQRPERQEGCALPGGHAAHEEVAHEPRAARGPRVAPVADQDAELLVEIVLQRFDLAAQYGLGGEEPLRLGRLRVQVQVQRLAQPIQAGGYLRLLPHAVVRSGRREEPPGTTVGTRAAAGPE